MSVKPQVGSSVTRTANGGYSLLKAPLGCTSASAGGATYNVEDDGCVCVPTGNAPELLAQGFIDTGGSITIGVADDPLPPPS